jgi:hypothetical protein
MAGKQFQPSGEALPFIDGVFARGLVPPPLGLAEGQKLTAEQIAALDPYVIADQVYRLLRDELLRARERE